LLKSGVEEFIDEVEKDDSHLAEKFKNSFFHEWPEMIRDELGLQVWGSDLINETSRKLAEELRARRR